MTRALSRLRTAVLGAWRHVRPGRFDDIRRAARGATALEIGGPSGVFRPWRLWPLYDRLAQVDLANFATHTLWGGLEAPVLPGGARVGRRIVAEADRLAGVDAGGYDFVLASHALEHVADPLGALAEWARVLVPGGRLVLVLPHREATFDHRRPVTTLAHLRDDQGRGTDASDTTHVEEVLRLHDLSRDPDAGGRDRFEARIRDNVRWRSMHHHVFDTAAVLALVDAAGDRIEFLDVQPPHHVCVVASPGAKPGANAAWLAPSAAWRASSPFSSDRTRGA